MSKMQKVWLGILLAIVLVPEILFQSTARLIHGDITIKDVTFGHSYVVVLVQSLAALVSAVLLFYLRKKFKHRWVCYVSIGLLILWAIVGYLAYYDALYSRISVGGF